MAIEFNCPNCGSLLRVNDDSAGKSAQCPKCEQVTTVPASMSPPMEDLAREPVGRESNNPFAPPTAIPDDTTHPTLGIRGIQPTAVEVGTILNYAIDIWKQNFGLLLGATVIIVVVSATFSGFAGGARAVIGDPDIGVLVELGINQIGNAVQLFLNIGMTTITLSLCRRRNADIGMLMSGGDRFLPILGTSILAFIAVAVGFLLLIVPGIILLLLFWPYYYLLVDKQCPAMESFSIAYSLGKQNWATTFLLSLLSFAIGLIGLLAFCVGIFAAMPLINVMWTSAYLMMKGEISNS